MSETTLQLTGLDAQDPLAYLAALGCLAATSEHCRVNGLPVPRLHFELGGRLLPSLSGPFEDPDALLDVLSADLEQVGGRGSNPRDPFLDFSYPGKDKGQGKHERVRDLKPPTSVFREFAQTQIALAEHGSRRSVDWAAAVLTDVAVDNNGGGKPFALHFTAGQQRFLNVALELVDGAGSKATQRGVDRGDLRAAVFGPWPNDRELKVFSWSPTQDRAYALRALNPSTDKKLGTPGADWLALRGCVSISSAPVGDKIATGGVHGGWKTGSFSYPVWSSPLDEDALRSLLRHPALRTTQDGALDRAARNTLPRGVEILSCGISRSDQGGYGAFSRPARR